MSPRAVLSELENCLDLLLNKNIALVKNPVVEEHVGGRIRITWRACQSPRLPLTTNEFASVEEYYQYVRHGAYSAILLDGSLLQLSYDVIGMEIVGHRLCYYPCPFEIDVEELRTEPIVDIVELYREAGDEYLRLRSPLRFDYDAQERSLGHPVSHLHMLSPHCRCPVVAPLSIGHFIRFIFKHFYPELWNAHSFLRQWRQRLGNRTITPIEETGLHFACRR